jgi:hypothetical protein
MDLERLGLKWSLALNVRPELRAAGAVGAESRLEIGSRVEKRLILLAEGFRVRHLRPSLPCWTFFFRRDMEEHGMLAVALEQVLGVI